MDELAGEGSWNRLRHTRYSADTAVRLGGQKHGRDDNGIIAEKIKDSAPYHLAYAGGEICPAYDKEGIMYNRFHNYTFVACSF